ncbi:MAG TPA: cellulase family glycosylhydrolase [Anaerolineales bacterium]|nr:cellulase family glycosylhydrolase [Anaerolineales bacterium]
MPRMPAGQLLWQAHPFHHRIETGMVTDLLFQKYYGFNFQWMFSWNPDRTPERVDQKALDFLVKYGFNFVRIPTDYRFWTEDFDYLHPKESAFKSIDGYLAACQSRGLHMSLNLHRAPGYCINRNDLEKHNLWLDELAQDAFVFLWEAFARRYKEVPGQSLSFDLVNEPPNLGQYGMTRENHAAIIRRTVSAIRAIDPNRAIVIDGLAGGSVAMPELSDLNVTHSGRGYHPMPVSHHKAVWWPDHARAPAPRYPGLRWQGRIWDRAALRDSYKSWREVEKRGVRIHIGEFGCFNRTPNDVAMRWYADLFGILKEFGWGYAMWNFQGSFGIIEHRRPGAKLELVDGYNLDRALLDLMIESRVSQ